jgi:hypothetical protein
MGVEFAASWVKHADGIAMIWGLFSKSYLRECYPYYSAGKSQPTSQPASMKATDSKKERPLVQISKEGLADTHARGRGIEGSQCEERES